MKGRYITKQLILSTALISMMSLGGCGKPSNGPPPLEEPFREEAPGIVDPREHENTSSLKIEQFGDTDVTPVPIVAV